jgi:preprotein translocase subunit SecA
VRREDPAEEEARMRRQAEELAKRMQFKHDEVAPVGSEQESAEPQQAAPGQPAAPITRDGPKVGRNDPCPCGSGKKYKHCHGQI